MDSLISITEILPKCGGNEPYQITTPDFVTKQSQRSLFDRTADDSQIWRFGACLPQVESANDGINRLVLLALKERYQAHRALGQRCRKPWRAQRRIERIFQ